MTSVSVSWESQVLQCFNTEGEGVGGLVTGVVPDEDHRAFSCSVCHRVQGQECSQGSSTTIHCSRLIQSEAAPRVSTTCLPDVITHDQIIGPSPLYLHDVITHDQIGSLPLNLHAAK